MLPLPFFPVVPFRMAFDVEEDVSEGFYKTKATLANSNDIDITIELQGEDELCAQIPLDQ